MATVQAVRGLDLEVPPGELLAILGPNGAGKSTAIGMLTGLTAPTSGRARLFGCDPLCSTDLDRSQEFYSQTEGMTPFAGDNPDATVFQGADGTSLLTYGRPGPNQADHPYRFWISHVEVTAAEPLARGVVLGDYRSPALNTVEHVETTAGIRRST